MSLVIVKKVLNLLIFLWAQKVVIISVFFCMAVCLLVLAFLFKPQTEQILESITPLLRVLETWWVWFSKTTFGENLIGVCAFITIFYVGWLFLFSGPTEDELIKNKKLHNDYAALIAGKKLQDQQAKIK